MGLPLRTVARDAARGSAPSTAQLTPSPALHLLEHLDPDTGDAVLAEALRLARRLRGDRGAVRG